MKHQEKEESSEEELEESDKETERKSNKMLFIVGGIILLLFLAFIIIRLNLKEEKPKEEAYTYNGFSFARIGGMWTTQVQKKGTNTVFTVPLHYGAYDVLNITRTGSIDERFEQSEVYITFDPDEADLRYVAVAAGELSLSIAQAMDVTPIVACTKNITEVCKDRPIVTCESTNKSTIYLKQADIPMLELNGNCVVVSGKEKEIIRATDRLILGLYGILKD